MIGIKTLKLIKRAQEESELYYAQSITKLQNELTKSQERKQIAVEALRQIIEPRLLGDFVNYETLLIEGQRIQTLAEEALTKIETLKGKE